jgi:hypothetical protein
MSRNPREVSSRPTVALTYRPAEKKVEGSPPRGEDGDAFTVIATNEKT